MLSNLPQGSLQMLSSYRYSTATLTVYGMFIFIHKLCAIYVWGKQPETARQFIRPISCKFNRLVTMKQPRRLHSGLPQMLKYFLSLWCHRHLILTELKELEQLKFRWGTSRQVWPQHVHVTEFIALKSHAAEGKAQLKARSIRKGDASRTRPQGAGCHKN